MINFLSFKEKEKKDIFLIIFLFILSSVCILGFIKGFIGFIVLGALFFYQGMVLKNRFNTRFLEEFSWASHIILFAYYIISLSIIYYAIGITILTLFLWNLVNFILVYKIGSTRIRKLIVGKFLSIKNSIIYFWEDKGWIKFLNILSLAVILLIAGYFFINPEINGNPSPWVGMNWVIYPAFFIISINLLLNYFYGKENKFISFLYLFIVVLLVAIKYIFSYGYDTLVHQAALDYIAKNGQITPITPFYIGGYVIESLIHFFSGWSFLTIERWFVPIVFVCISLASGSYALLKLKCKNCFNILPLALLFILPNQFNYTTPYAFSLVWMIFFVVPLHFYIVTKNKNDFWLALISALVSFFIHPFIGLSILVWMVGIFASNKFKKNKLKKAGIAVSFIISSTIVILAFCFYSILNKSFFSLANPVIYFENFLNLFHDPFWYNRGYAGFGLWLIYFYERIQFVFIIFLILFYSLITQRKYIINILLIFAGFLWLIYIFNKIPFVFIVLLVIAYAIFHNSKTKNNNLLLLIGLSYIISAWLFMSSLDASELTNSDKVNYSFRLLEAVRWILWPLLLIAILKIFELVKKKSKKVIIIFSIIFALLLTVNWYLVYPRKDAVSRTNVNSIRAIDYLAIEQIYENELGKDGYVVMSNMLFVGGATQKYGFGPYYKTSQGEISYYSMPMSSILFLRYTDLMAAEHFQIDKIYEVLRETGVNKAYLITTDYWSLYGTAMREAEAMADDFWYFDNKVFLYSFTLKK